MSNPEEEQPIPKVKVAVLGEGGVGKTSLTYRFLNKEILEGSDATVEDTYKTMEIINNRNVQISILDTAGQEGYQNLLDTWIKPNQGFILVFSLTEKESLEKLESRIERIIEMHGNNCPIIIVGNKKDLIDQRCITPEEAQSKCTEWNLPYVETSAKLNEDCKTPLIQIVKKILNKKKVQRKDENAECCIIY